MTALNAFQFPGVFYMCSDTATYNNKAIVTGLRPKIFPIPTAKAALGSSGSAELGDAVSHGVRGAGSLRGLLAEVRAAAERFIQDGICENYGPFTHTFVVAGFSEVGDQQIWELKFRPSIDPIPEFSPVEPPYARISPVFDLQFSESELRTDPEGFCRRVLERQRAMRIVTEGWNDGAPTQVVGGQGLLVTITSDCITQKVIASWPDAIGRRIGDGGSEAAYTAGAPGYSLNTAEGKIGPTSTAGSMISAATGTLITDITTRTSAIFDSVTNQPSSSGAQKASATSFYGGKTYSGGKAVGKAIVYGTNNIGFVSGSPSVTINLRGKNGSAPADASDGDLLGTLTFTNTSNESAGRTVNSTDTTTVYDHVFVQITQSGSAATMCVAEVQFYEPGTTAAMTVVTTAQTVDESVDRGRVLIEYNPVDAIALNTDLTVEVTCDGGSNWQSGTLSLKTAYGQGGRSIAETDDVTCVSGTSYAARIKTANNKMVEIHGVSMSVR